MREAEGKEKSCCDRPRERDAVLFPLTLFFTGSSSIFFFHYAMRCVNIDGGE